LYDRAEVALNSVHLDPEISDEQATFERLALERAIRKIENDALARAASLQRLMAICADAHSRLVVRGGSFR